MASMAACSISTYAYAHAHDAQSCRIDISDLPDIVDPPEPAPPPDPLMSALPNREIYEMGTEYPNPVRSKAVRWAKVFEVPASWLISLGYVESRNQPMAKNESGATGALQIKLARARDLVTWIGRSKWRAHRGVQEILARFWNGMRDDLLNLDLNIMLAAFELHHLRRRFGNDHHVISAAYNQGEGCIARCLRRGLPLPDRAIEFIARIERARQMGYV
jgi:soluble lytic murein transglycosylase-like protein